MVAANGNKAIPDRLIRASFIEKLKQKTKSERK